jgi:hypothetical protein
MEPFTNELEMAQKRLAVADHILTQTFPLLKDPKLLLAVLEHLCAAGHMSVNNVLKYERMMKRIPSYVENSDHKLNLFAERCAKRYHVEPKQVQSIQELTGFLDAHKASGMEFRRKDRFVICGDDYRMKTLTFEKLKTALTDMKQFVGNISEGLSTYNGRIIN